MKKRLLALICALALVFSLVGCTISAPDTVGSIGDFEITSGMYLLAQYGAYQQAAQLAGTDQDTTDVKAFLKETITTDSDRKPRGRLQSSASPSPCCRMRAPRKPLPPVIRTRFIGTISLPWFAVSIAHFVQ